MKKSLKLNSETGTSGCAVRGNEIDRISQLPDDILHYVLSFVDIVDVVRSSMLSRRWKCLWRTMPYLNFDFDEFMEQKHHTLLPTEGIYENFDELINWILMSQGGTKLTRFRISFSDMFWGEKADRWITIATWRNVQEVELRVNELDDGVDIFQLPDSIFRCESLRVLRLRLPWCVLELPSYLKFKNLTALHLEDIEFIDEDLTRRLFSECIFLEDLSLVSCAVRTMKVLDISSSSLKCLTVRNYYYENNEASGEVYGFSNCELKISCPNLLSLQFSGGAAKNYRLDNVSSLDNLCMDLYYGREMDDSSDIEVGRLVCQILEQVENIRVLEADIIQFLSYVIEDLRGFSTTFIRLKSINLEFFIDEDYTRTLFLLLKHCPNLESLTLYIDEIGSISDRSFHFHDDEGYAFLINRLKSVQLTNFKGKGSELDFVMFLLCNGLQLENLTIVWSNGTFRRR